MRITNGIVEKTIEKALAEGIEELITEKDLEWTEELRDIAKAEEKDMWASVEVDNWYRELEEAKEYGFEERTLNALAFDVRTAIKDNLAKAIGIALE